MINTKRINDQQSMLLDGLIDYSFQVPSALAVWFNNPDGFTGNIVVQEVL